MPGRPRPKERWMPPIRKLPPTENQSACAAGVARGRANRAVVARATQKFFLFMLGCTSFDPDLIPRSVPAVSLGGFRPATGDPEGARVPAGRRLAAEAVFPRRRLRAAGKPAGHFPLSRRKGGRVGEGVRG